VSILRNAFNSGDIGIALAGTYFEKLANALKRELQNTKKLRVVFPSLDRIFRPLGYNPKGGTSTWNYTDEDYALLQKWLEHALGARATDVQFAVIDDSPAGVVRSNSIKSGQRHTGRRGGRPKQIAPKEEALRLAKEKGWNSGRIHRHLIKQYKFEMSVRVIQKCLKKAGLQAKPGRPKGEKNANT